MSITVCNIILQTFINALCVMYDTVIYLFYSLVSLSSHAAYISLIYGVDLNNYHCTLLNSACWISDF